MDNEIKKLLQDILICLENIENYIGAKKVFDNYNGNLLLQDAVERNLITIYHWRSNEFIAKKSSWNKHNKCP